MKRKMEFFEENKLKNKKVITAQIPILYSQERDWTCAIACIRTILGAKCNICEDMIIHNYKLSPGPLFSKDIKENRIISGYDVIYGCDGYKEFDDILDLVSHGYNVMFECMLLCSHWIVFLGYYPLTDEDIENAKILIYEPYYDEVRLINCDEFISIWEDGENKEIKHDFIAIKR